MLLLIALATLLGVHPTVIAIGVVAVKSPVVFLIGVAAWSVVTRLRSKPRHLAQSEASFLEGMAAELRSGASLRSAVADAAERSELDLSRPVRLAASGRPMEMVATELRQALPINGAVVAPALVLSSSAGSGVAGLFDALAIRAAEVADDRRERRASSSQARLSAWLVGGMPALVAGAIFLLGDVPLSAGPGLAIAVVGFGLQALGGAVVWLMLRNHR